VAFLLDDPEHLHDLLRAGIQSYGQLESLLDHGHADAYLPSEAARKVTSRAVVVQAICEAWKVGRGRPVDSISYGYTPHVTKMLQGLAVVKHCPANAGPTMRGVANIEK